MENITEVANINAIAKVIEKNINEDFFFVPWIGKNMELEMKRD